MNNPDLFPASDFDTWAETYDQDVLIETGFPFDGYSQALDEVFARANALPGMSVLDVGCGTGLLAARFAAAGCEVWGTDFSEAMLAKARARLPGVHWLLHDLRKPWPVELKPQFDRIVSGYAIHHLEDGDKMTLLADWMNNHLLPGGRVLIADISFGTRPDWETARKLAGEGWDEEFYWTVNDLMPGMINLGWKVIYRQISYCAGVYEISWDEKLAGEDGRL